MDSHPISGGHRSTPAILWLLACLLLALVQMSWAGYQLGVGNQGIQIPFLETLHDPQLFQKDSMVTDTLGSYPSFFFHICAKFLSIVSLPTLYLVLHWLTTAAVLFAVAMLAQALVKNRWAGLLAVLMMLAGHHQALAGESLYSTGFTHTWAVFPLSLLALMHFYRKQYAEAFALAGVIFNFHALEAGHLVLIMGFVALMQVRRVGWARLVFLCAIFVLAATPTLVVMARQHQRFDAEWLQLMHIRSADHSFPSSWWQDGTPDIPRFLCILSLAALAMGFRFPPVQRRKTFWIAGAVGGMFLLGTLFTDVWPVPLVIRAQFFRSSRLMMVLAIVLIGHGAVGAWRLLWRQPATMKPWQAWLEGASALLTLLTLALPPLLALLPVALAVALLVALLNGRLAWWQALVAGGTMLVCIIAWQSIHFVIPGLPPAFSWRSLFEWHGPPVVAWALFGGAIALWLLTGQRLRRQVQLAFSVGAAVCVLGLSALILPAVALQPRGQAAWVDAQRWARAHTAKDALFLTPAQQAGFRIYSERSIVGEMRDGTQLYFKAGFAKPWWERMTALQPGILPDEEGHSLLSPGKQLDQLEDPQIIEIAQKFGAQYVVLPHNEERTLERVYDNKVWSIYRPQVAVVSADSHSVELTEEDKFLRETVLPAIDKNRKSDVQILFVDAGGQPVDSLSYRVRQATSAFSFGCSLPFFQQPDIDTRADYKPPAVTPAELNHFLEVFNYSVIPFSGQWRFLEPIRGKPNYPDLDQYVAWCHDHGVRTELHFVAGYQPQWLKSLASAEQSMLLQSHAEALARRYGDRIDDWQISNEHVGIDQAREVAAKIRAAAPHARIGISDELRFSPADKPARVELSGIGSGLEDMKKLKDQGVKIDFFSIAARRPVGLWASGKRVYQVLDNVAQEGGGVPVHITEFGIPVGARIEGDVRDGQWTPQARAEYYERFFSICFSHPGVEAINLMGIGPDIWLEGEGLLNEKMEPTPAFDALKRLITQRWRTQLSGTLGLDGRVAFRGFHGAYELALTFSNGRTATASFDVEPGKSEVLRYRVDSGAGTLRKMGE